MPSEFIYSVFVSSTYEDLREERAAVQKALLQLHCMPIGMELFGSADEETWEFIKRQIESCDYYVVVAADKYGSTADDDDLSYTEKEYNYARDAKKPVLAFVHGDRKSIRRDRTEEDPNKRSKLEAFIEKVRRSPVSFFTGPNDLATQVTVSFVNLRERHPAIGFIRANQTHDLKEYTELLEENVRLKAELADLRNPAVTLFPQAADIVSFAVRVGRKKAGDFDEENGEKRHLTLTWSEILIVVSDVIIRKRAQRRDNDVVYAVSNMENVTDDFKDESVLRNNPLRRWITLLTKPGAGRCPRTALPSFLNICSKNRQIVTC